MSLSLEWTLALLAAALALGAFARWQSARPVTPGRVRMAPWTLILVICGVAVILAVGNLMVLSGITPPPQR